ncbi:MAG: response regulator transcription factor, partial [Clostridia bacterium]|nr:response regulator transcription factor [Clostridia bacterium]
MPQSILLIEDEESLARFVELELLHEGYGVRKCFDGREGLDTALREDFDLILLDIMLPSLNGLEVLRRLRREKNTPVILLTARDAVMDKVTGLDTGADDYITKPFAIDELLARLRAALRKPAVRAAQSVLAVGPVQLDPLHHTVTVNGSPVALTGREF